MYVCVCSKNEVCSFSNKEQNIGKYSSKNILSTWAEFIFRAQAGAQAVVITLGQDWR